MKMMQQSIELNNSMLENRLYANFEEDDFVNQMEVVRTKVATELGFQKLESTNEYVETTWYNSGSADSPDCAESCQLYADYLQHLLDGGKKEFVCSELLYFGHIEFIAALSWLAIPMHKDAKKSYKVESDGKRGIFIKSANNLNSIIFK